MAEPAFVKEIFGRDYGLELARRTKIGFYRPLLVTLDYGLFHIFGPSPFGFHVVVLLTFSFSCALLTGVSIQALGQSRRSVAVAIGCLAAIHPVRTEFAVFFMTMPDLLMEIYTLFIIGICLGFFGNWPATIRASLVACFGLAAGLTKETGFFVVGAVGATLVLAGFMRRTNRESIGYGLAAFAGLGIALALRFWEGVGLPAGGSSPIEMFAAGSNPALAALVRGVRNLTIPSPTIFMSLVDSLGIVGAQVGIAAALALAAFAVIWLIQRGAMFESLVVAWLSGGLVTLLLYCAREMPYSDRYIPSGAAIVLLCLFIESLWQRIHSRWPGLGKVPALLGVAYFGAFAVYGWLSTVECETALAFFTTMADENPRSYYPRLVLANLMFERHRDLEAAAYIREAVELAPKEPRVRAIGLSVTRRLVDANEFQRGLDALTWSANGLPESGELWSLRAKCEAGLGNYPAALNSSRRAVELAPGQPEFQRQLDEITAAMSK